MIMNRWRLPLQQVLLLILVAAITACSQPAPPSTSATPTVDPAHLTAFARVQSQFTPSPIPKPTPTLIPPPMGPVPHNCPPGPTPQPIFGALGPVVGSSPVWVNGFDGPHAVVYLDQAFFDKPGWGWKMVWEIGPNYTHLVTLHGANLQNAARMWFQFDGPPTTSPILDPRHPDHPASAVGGDWAEWGSYVFVPAAGCYYLEASWPGGHWRITFAAGCCWPGVGEKVTPGDAEQKAV